ncbi:T9SS type A sorting domain-containing protein [Bacteroidota bacterium]
MKVLNRFFLILLSVFISLLAVAQERLYDLGSNARLSGVEDGRKFKLSTAASVGDTLDLPFFDDFSEPFSRLRVAEDVYPDQQKWTDKRAYINNHMAINPISQGVATLDGLDHRGQAYGFVFPSESSEPSDSLTSRPIRLAGSTDVYLSFFFQPQGLGNAPEAKDSLVLEFKDTVDTWRTVWKTSGFILTDFNFEQQVIPVEGAQYLYDGFQFRFRNYASRAGFLDHWHLDYIELDEGRSLTDTLIHDLAFLGQTSFTEEEGNQAATVSLLKDYTSMPWTHFKTDPDAFMGDTNYVMIKNNYDSVVTANYSYKIYDFQDTELFQNLESSPVVFADIICGNEFNACNKDTLDNLRFSLEGFVYPTSAEITSDSSFFKVKNILRGTNDNVHYNDSSVYKQEFYNYYAYDDGTAEAALGLGELDFEGMMALRYDIKMADSLQAIQIYLNPVRENLANEKVNLVVWSGNSEPEVELWRSESLNLRYTYGFNNFYHYFLDQPLKIEGGASIFIGWIQQPALDKHFSIGFDKRTDVSNRLFYNLGAGWEQTFTPGALMMRPVFGKAYNWVGVTEKVAEQIQVYPNPTTGQVFMKEAFAGQFKDAQISIFDLTGRVVHAEKGYSQMLNIQHLQAGTYILQVQTALNSRYTQRIMLLR